MANYGSPYLHKRFCSNCKRWVRKDDYRCPICGIMTRGSNVRTGGVQKMRISGLTGKEAQYVKLEA